MKIIISIFILLLFLVPSIIFANQVQLQWDPVEQEIDGYKMFMRTDNSNYNYYSPVWVGTDITCIIYGLEESIKYFFIVRAYIENKISTNSNEVCYIPGFGECEIIEGPFPPDYIKRTNN